MMFTLGFEIHLLLLLLSRISRVRLCATPETAAHQAPPSLGFSRQEHWSGLPFPSPMHESEKWKVKVKSLSRVRLLATPWTAAHQAPPSMGISRQEYWTGVPLPFCKIFKLWAKRNVETISSSPTFFLFSLPSWFNISAYELGQNLMSLTYTSKYNHRQINDIESILIVYGMYLEIITHTHTHMFDFWSKQKAFGAITD